MTHSEHFAELKALLLANAGRIDGLTAEVRRVADELHEIRHAVDANQAQTDRVSLALADMIERHTRSVSVQTDLLDRVTGLGEIGMDTRDRTVRIETALAGVGDTIVDEHERTRRRMAAYDDRFAVLESRVAALEHAGANGNGAG
jgi:hypothetical protein